MADIEITVNVDAGDIEKTARKMDVLPAFKDGVFSAATWVKGEISEYPPASEANMPGPYPKRWYVRGKGPHWARKGGGVGSRSTSKTLGKMWTAERKNGGLSALVGNNTSYGPYVQSKEHQAAFHGRRGWQTVEDFVIRRSDEVLKRIEDFVQAAIKGVKKQ